MLTENETKLFIKLHGETARTYADQALQLGYTYVFPDPTFDVEKQELIRSLLQYSSLVDFQVFRKPKHKVFSLERVRTYEIRCLFEFGKTSYPEEIFNDLDEWWDELDIYRQAKSISAEECREWFYKHLTANSGNALNLGKFSTVFDFLMPLMGKEVFYYCIVDDRNENCPFAPYFFFGEQILIMTAKQWD